MTYLYRPEEPHNENQKTLRNDSDRSLPDRLAPNQPDRRQSIQDLSTQGLLTVDFQPPTEVREGDYSFSIYVDLPGVSAQTINITSCPTSVTIQGERRSPHTNSQTGSQLVSSDRAIGSFERVIQLSQPILGEQVYAEYSHGVLKLELPKQLCVDDQDKMPATCRSVTPQVI